MVGRPKGSRSEDHAERRRALAQEVFQCLVADGGTSLNAMADRLGVSRPTLRHYFGDRQGAIRAALEVAAAHGEPCAQEIRALPAGNAEQTLQRALRSVVVAWRDYGVGHLHHVGLKIGLEDAGAGATYLQRTLEPLLQAFEALLERLAAAGALAPLDARAGALMLVSPVVLALLHQGGLGGAASRPLDLDALARQVVRDFCRLHAAPG